MKNYSLDRRCGVLNTFHTHNRTFEFKNFWFETLSYLISEDGPKELGN